MRVLITASPGVGHVFPAVTTAWALRAAGHDVILATSGSHELASQAGLQVVDTAPGVEFAEVFGGFMAARGSSFGGGEGSEVELTTELFAVVGSKFVDETVRLVGQWRPDLVIHTQLDAVGPLVAAMVGVPAVVHTVGIAQPTELWTRVAQHFAAEYDRFGVTATEPAAVLDVSPPSLRVPDSTGWSLRYVPYNGGAVLPDWLRAQRERPRVTVTLGTVAPMMAGVGALAPFMAAAGSVDADFVVTLGGADPADFGTLPANVRLLDWVPLGALLAASDAVIHHGGSGTALTALNAGLPQLVLPQGADQFRNADVIAKCGAGAVVRPAELDADRLAELASEDSMRAAAVGIAAEMATQPTPSDLVPDLIALAR